MDAKGVVGDVRAYGVLEVDVELVDARWVVDVCHDLISPHPSLLQYFLAAEGVECL